MDEALDILLLVSFFIGGVYAVWTSLQMRGWTELRANKFIYPNGCTLENCQEPQAFLRYMRPRVLLFGVLCLLTAVTFLCGTYVPQCPRWMLWITLALGVSAVALYVFNIRRVGARFW